MAIQTFPVVLDSTLMLTPSVKHFVFNAPQTTQFSFIPGQFITIHFEVDGKTIKRSYSIANEPIGNNRIEFSAGYVKGGPGTQFLFNLKPGDIVNITGPFGRLILKDEDPKRYIFVATSTGVVPFRSMITEIKRKINKNPRIKIIILEGVQKREDLLFKDEFLGLCKQYPQVTFRAQYSREENIELSPHEHCGYVQSSFSELNLNPSQDKVYLCGNPHMIDEAFNYLKENGFELQQVVREKYISGK